MANKQVATEFEFTTFKELEDKDFSVDITINSDRDFINDFYESDVEKTIILRNINKLELFRLRKQIDLLFPDGDRVNDYIDE